MTISLLTDHFADFTGHLADRPDVDIHEGDGRSYLARSDGSYDLVWFVAPDSYAATNAASSGAFVLSESYLYTTEMIEETLGTSTTTASWSSSSASSTSATPDSDRALHRDRAEGTRAARHRGPESAPARRRAPDAERGRSDDGRSEAHAVHRRRGRGLQRPRSRELPQDEAVYAPGGAATAFADHPVNRWRAATTRRLPRRSPSTHGRSRPISDDAPFFWHFSSFGSVLRHIFEPLDVFNPEDVIGERVLLLLLGIALAYAAIFLLLPFVFVRRQWSALPAKGISAVYFAALGLGFMFFEITMIQRLDAIPRLSDVLAHRDARVDPRVDRDRCPAEPALRRADRTCRSSRSSPASPSSTSSGSTRITDSLLSTSLAVRVIVSLLVLAPLGICLGMFMPLGLGARRKHDRTNPSSTSRGRGP